LKGFHVSTKHLKDRDEIPQLLDSGCDIELASWRFVKQRQWAIYKLDRPTILEYMDGRRSEELWYATDQVFRLGPPGDRRTMKIQYRCCDIGDDLVLGDNWLVQAGVLVSFKKRTWQWEDPVSPDHVRVRATIEAFSACKARKRIIQGEIQHNEPPDWVKRDFSRMFTDMKPGELPPHRPGIDYSFEMKEDWLPRREKPRRFSPEEKRMFRDLARIETNDFTGWRWEFSKSPQCAQMLWAAKAGGKKRPCIDYRRFNLGLKDDTGPLPSIEAMIQDMAGYKYLTSLDLPRAYNQIRIADGGCTLKDGTYMTFRQLAAFQCGDDLFEPTVMQFGTKTAVSHFQRFIHQTLRRHWGSGVYAYLDNIIIGADDIDSLERLEADVLNDLAAEKLPIALDKCEWHKTSVQFCGFLIGGGKVTLDPAKLDAIRDWTIPHAEQIPEGEKRTAVREFIGFCNFYREAVDRFALTAAPISALMGPKYPWRWGESEQRSFDRTKQSIIESIERTAFDEKAPKVVHSDASQYGAISGGVSQRVGDKLQPLGFYSRKLTDAEMRYTVTELELMAIAETMAKFRHWLHACPHEVQVYSDHAALLTMQTTPLDPKRARIVIGLCEFRFKIHHIPGRENRAADALSRVGTHGRGRLDGLPFEHADWFAPSGVRANELLGMSHRELWRRFIEPMIGQHPDRRRIEEAFEKHKRMGTALTLRTLVSLLILSSNISQPPS
jgi:hypothetical protein